MEAITDKEFTWNQMEIDTQGSGLRVVSMGEASMSLNVEMSSKVHGKMIRSMVTVFIHAKMSSSNKFGKLGQRLSRF